MKDEEEKKAADFILEMLKAKGMAVSTMKDGTIILMSRKFLEELLAKEPKQDVFQVFAAKPEFKN